MTYTIVWLAHSGLERQHGRHPRFRSYKKARAYCADMNAQRWTDKFGVYVVIQI